MLLDELMNDADVCGRCGHQRDCHRVRLGRDDLISRVECDECPGTKMRGWHSVQRVNRDEQTIDVEDRYLEEVIIPNACWTAIASVCEPVHWSAVSERWRLGNHGMQRRRLVQDLIDPEREKGALWSLQQRLCCGCQYELPLHVLEIDHIIPKSEGGGDQAGNIQLLCPKCNKIKGSRSMEYLTNRVVELGIIRSDLVRRPYLLPTFSTGPSRRP